MRAASSRCAENWRIWLRASTSSPTRFISLSSRPTSTRMVESAIEWPFEAPASAGGIAPSAAGGGGATGASVVPRPGRPARAAGRRRRSATAASGSSRRRCGPPERRRSAGGGGWAVSLDLLDRLRQPRLQGLEPRLAFGAGRFDGREDRLDGVHRFEDQRHQVRRQRPFPVPKLVQQRLGDVGDLLEDAEVEEAARPLDGVNRAEDAVEQPQIVGPLLQVHHLLFEARQVLVALDQEVLDDVAEIVLLHVPPRRSQGTFRASGRHPPTCGPARIHLLFKCRAVATTPRPRRLAVGNRPFVVTYAASTRPLVDDPLVSPVGLPTPGAVVPVSVK